MNAVLQQPVQFRAIESASRFGSSRNRRENLRRSDHPYSPIVSSGTRVVPRVMRRAEVCLRALAVAHDRHLRAFLTCQRRGSRLPVAAASAPLVTVARRPTKRRQSAAVRSGGPRLATTLPARTVRRPASPASNRASSARETRAQSSIVTFVAVPPIDPDFQHRRALRPPRRSSTRSNSSASSSCATMSSRSQSARLRRLDHKNSQEQKSVGTFPTLHNARRLEVSDRA